MSYGYTHQPHQLNSTPHHPPPKNPESSIQNLFGIFSHIETQLFSRNLIFCFPYNFFYAKAKKNEIELNFMKLSSMHNFIHHF